MRLETEHYLILSTAPREQVEEIGRLVEVLYSAYVRKIKSAVAGNSTDFLKTGEL